MQSGGSTAGRRVRLKKRKIEASKQMTWEDILVRDVVKRAIEIGREEAEAHIRRVRAMENEGVKAGKKRASGRRVRT